MAHTQELWIIGNGFNKALAQTEQFSEVASAINDIANLWSEFDGLVGEIQEQLKKDTGHTFPDEKIVEFIFTVLHALESKDIFQTMIHQYCFNILFAKFSKSLSDKLLSVARNFINIENKEFYSSISRLLDSDFLSYWQQRREKVPTTLITTNYDGIIDTVFARDKQGHFGKGGMGDYFRSCDSDKHISSCTQEYVNGLGDQQWRGVGFCFNDFAYLESSMKLFTGTLLHLHGSYKFWKHIDSGIELKIDKSATGAFMDCIENDNWFPMVVFGPPSQKLQTIGKYKTLQAHYSSLKYILTGWSSSDKGKQSSSQIKLVIWGTKFNSDPHLLELLKSAIGSPKSNINEVVILLSNETSAKSLFKNLTSNTSHPSKPSFRYVSFSNSQNLLDVVKVI